MKTVLIVDDDALIRQIAKDILDGENYRVFTSKDTHEGLNILRKEKIDAILLDVAMPEESGFEMIPKINEISADFAIIIMTAFASTDSAIEAIRMGADDFIRKPLKAEELLPALRKAIDKKTLLIKNKTLLQRLKLFQMVSKEISSTLDLPELLEKIMQTTKTIMGVEACSVLLLDEATGELVFEVALGKRGKDVKKFRIKPGQGIAGWVFEHKEPILINDVKKDARFYQAIDKKTGFETRSMVAAPLSAKGNTLGVIQVINKADEALFDVDDRDMLITLSDQIAVGIANARMAEKLLTESEEKFRKISSSATDAIMMIDNDGNISFWNEAAHKILGYTAKEVIGKELATFIVPERHQDAHRKGFQKFRETGKGTVIGNTLELVAMRRDGSEFPIELSISAVRLKDRWNAIGILRDITKRKATEERTKHHMKQLSALRSIDKAIVGSLDLSITLDIIIEQTISLLKIDAADILLYKPHLETLEYAAGRGFNTQALQYTKLKIGDSHAGQAALERRVVHTTDLRADREGFKRSKHLAEEGFISYYGAPLIAKGVIKGVLEVFNRNVRDHDKEWVDFLESLAGQAAIAIDNATLFDDLQRANIDLAMAYDETIEGWSRALDLRDKETEGHSQRVTELTLRIAQSMGISEAAQTHIRRGALLHDIGKMGIPDKILLKPSPLDDEEWEIMRRHPILAHELLFPIDYLRPALDIPHCHHEKWDGTGYPQGLKGEQIPLAARIFAVVDIYDALCSERPYRPAWPKIKALGEIRLLTGNHLDPKVVEVFLKMDKETAI
jgi:PAS domain S-box-containing protein